MELFSRGSEGLHQPNFQTNLVIALMLSLSIVL